MSTLAPKLSKKELADVWSELDARRLGFVELGALHAYLSERFGKDKSSSKSVSVVERVIAKIIERSGPGGMKGLQRSAFFALCNGLFAAHNTTYYFLCVQEC
jgi:hypothetical protein